MNSGFECDITTLMSKEMILVTGSSGTLGTAIKLEAERRNLPLLVPSHKEFDITDYDSCREFTSHQPIDVIIHSAAIIDVEQCYHQPVEAFRVNTLGSLNMARIAKKHEARLIYVSTNAVFPGYKREEYYETDPVGPINLYGMTKLMGELLVTQILPLSSLIVRPGWLFGPTPEKDTRFVGAIIRQSLSSNTIIKAVFDKIGSPTYAEDVAGKLLDYMDTQTIGIRHLANRGAVSRFEVAKKIAELWDLRVAVQSVSSEAFPSSALRPDYLGLTSMYADSQLSSWEDALERYHDRFQNREDFATNQVLAV